MVGRTRRGELPPWKPTDYGRANDVPGVGGRKQNSRSATRPETRKVTSQRKRHSNKDKGLLQRDEPPARKMKTRSSNITCLDYGPDRRIVWPDYLFCRRCDWWEEACHSGTTSNKSRTSHKYQCELEHTHPLYPTILKDIGSSKVPPCTVSSDIELPPSQDSAEGPPQPLGEESTNLRPPQRSWEYNDLFRECAHQQDIINKLRADISRMRQERSRLIHLVAHPLQAIRELLRSGIGTARKQKLVSDVLSVFFVEDVCRAECITLFAQYVNENIYSAFSVLQLMDREGGKLNYQSLRLLSELEKEHKSSLDVPYKGSILPTVYALKKAAAKVEDLGKHRVPFDISRTALGAESIEFRPSDVAACILQGYGLSDVAKTGSEATLAQAIDGSRFSKALGFVMYGLKVTDYRAMHPKTMEPLVSPTATSLQSRHNQFPLKMVIGRESSSMYEEFRDVIETSTQFCGVDSVESKVSLTNICTDLSATWKATGVGGAVKNATFFCHCCSTRSRDCATPNAARCLRWCSTKPPTWKCFHQHFLDEETVERSKNKMEEVLSNLPSASGLNDIVQFQVGTRLSKSGDDPEVPTERSKLDPGSVHFDLGLCEDQGTKVQYSLDINHDLEIRGMSQAGSLSSRQIRLKEALVKEKKFLLLCDAVEHGKKRASALFLTLNNPPCILHLQNRVYLKKLSVVFNKGLNNALGGRLDDQLFSAEDDSKPSTGNRFSRFVEGLENIFNTQIWGTPFAPTHWSLPYDKQTYSLLSLSIDNGKCKTAMKNFALIADYCLTTEDRCDDYKTCMSLLEIVMTKLRQRSKFTDEEIQSFQSSVDNWYQLWHELEKDNGVTNYIHMLFSGHVADYLYSHRNLYAFSNQGWEAFNSLVKEVFFRRTARGGGREYNLRSRLVPVARWLQRRMVFLLIKTEEELDSMLSYYGESSTRDEPIADDFNLQACDAEII